MNHLNPEHSSDPSSDSPKKKLPDDVYHVTHEGGTEAPFSGKYYNHNENGIYQCIVCDAKLFESETKLEAGSEPVGLKGWPSFDNAIKGSIEYKKDTSLGMNRTEVVCAKCGAHLGHVFDDPKERTGMHFCINSCALDFDGK